MENGDKRSAFEPLENRLMFSGDAGSDPVAQDIEAIQGQVAAIEAALNQEGQKQLSPLLTQTFEGADATFGGARNIDLGYVPEYNLQDFTIRTSVTRTATAAEQVIVGLNSQANGSYGYSGMTLNFGYGGRPLKIWYAAPNTNYEVFTHFIPELGREYDITVSKQGQQLRLYVDGAFIEEVECPVAEIKYNATGHTMVSGLWSGEQRRGLYPLNGAISALDVYDGAYTPAALEQESAEQAPEEVPPVQESVTTAAVQEVQAQTAPLLNQTFEGSDATFSGARVIDLGYDPKYNLQDFTIHTSVTRTATAAEQVIVGLNSQANGSYGYSGMTLNFGYGGGPLKIWYAAPNTNYEVFTHFIPELGREYDITVTKQGQQLRVFIDGTYLEDITFPVAEIQYNETGHTMVSGLWSGEQRRGLYPLNGAISELAVYDGSYVPAELESAESPIVPDLRVLQMDGPNVLVHVASPMNQSVVNIGGNGTLATRTQSHEGGTSSSVVQVTINAGNPRGTYAIQLMDRPSGFVLDSVPVYWNGSSLSLINTEDAMEGLSPEWDIPPEYSMSSSLVRSNLESDLAARSGLTLTTQQAEAAFYERYPQYKPENLQATINAEYARLPGFTRGQAQDRVLSQMFDYLERVHRGLNAYNGVLQSSVFPAAMNVFRGVLDGVPESQLYEQLNVAMCSFGRGTAVDLYTYTTLSAPSRSQVLTAARDVFFGATDLMEYYHAKDEQLLAKEVIPETEDPFITAAKQRGELWAQYMGQISAGQMTAAEALTALAANVSSTTVAQVQQETVESVLATVTANPTLLAQADDLLTLAEMEIGGVNMSSADAFGTVRSWYNQSQSCAGFDTYVRAGDGIASRIAQGIAAKLSGSQGPELQMTALYAAAVTGIPAEEFLTVVEGRADNFAFRLHTLFERYGFASLYSKSSTESVHVMPEVREDGTIRLYFDTPYNRSLAGNVSIRLITGTGQRDLMVTEPNAFFVDIDCATLGSPGEQVRFEVTVPGMGPAVFTEWVEVAGGPDVVTTEQLSDDPIENVILQRLHSPVEGIWRFHNNSPSTHVGREGNAVDMNLNSGDYEMVNDLPVAASAAGKVIYVDKEKLGWVILEHTTDINGQTYRWFTGYMHMRDISVNVGDQVDAGHQIGLVGNTGIVGSTSHLHFAVYIGENFFDEGTRSIDIIDVLRNEYGHTFSDQ